jgi:hypothetical protein
MPGGFARCQMLRVIPRREVYGLAGLDAVPKDVGHTLSS